MSVNWVAKLLDAEINVTMQGENAVYTLASGGTFKVNDSSKSIYDTFANLFAKGTGVYEKTLSNLLTCLTNIMGSTCQFDANNKLTFNSELETNCDAGQEAYQYYVKTITLHLETLQKYLQRAQDTLAELESLISNNEPITEANIQFFDQLKIYDAISNDIVEKMSRYYQLTTETNNGDNSENWEEMYLDYSSPADSLLSGDITSLDKLRNVQVTTITNKYDNQGQLSEQTIGKKALSVFNELTLLDKLKYIRLYYTIDTDASNEKRIYFPDDSENGFPCLPNKEIIDPVEDTQEIGALELFYIGYIIDRDGPANALASFMEVKTQALRENIAITMKRITSLKHYTSLITRALELVNASQSNSGTRIPDAAWIALTYVCGSVIRNLVELKDENGNYLKDSDGNEIKDSYYVIYPNEKTTDDSYHLTTSNRYLLVKATTDGLDAFLGNQISDSNSNGMKYESYTLSFKSHSLIKIDKTVSTIFYNTEKKVSHSTIEIPKNEFSSKKKEVTVHVEESKYAEGGISISESPHIYSNFKITSAITQTAVTQDHNQTCKLSSEVEYWTENDLNKYSNKLESTETNNYTCNAGNNILLLSFDDYEAAKKWLPKELGVSPISYTSVMGYTSKGSGDYVQYWRTYNNSAGIWTGLVESWTTTIETSIENVKSQIESVNNDISTMNSKINTFNASASTFRNRAASIYNNIISNIG